MMTQTMKTNQEHSQKNWSQGGNALIYVLIAVALFAALSMTLMRQTNDSEAGSLSDEKAEIYATQLIARAAQVKSAIDQMLFMGASVNELDFALPSAVGFDAGTVIYKVYHPQGGGVVPGRIPKEAQLPNGNNPDPGWYMGRFNNVDWTPSTADDVMLTAFRISKEVCAKINKKITGSPAIPAIAVGIGQFLVDASLFSGSNAELTTNPSATPVCAACYNTGSLCVSNTSLDAYGFYTILADQ